MIAALKRGLARRRAAAEARRWCARRSGRQLSLQEWRDFQIWLAAKPENRLAYSRTQLLWEQLGEVAPALRDLKLPVRVPVARRPAVPAAGWRAGLAGLAAAAVLALYLAPAPLLPVRIGDFQRTYATEVAEISQIKLPDSSTLRLGAKTEVAVVELGEVRRVELLAGEAFFDIAHDASRPFIVEAQGARIRVLGTRFNVHTGPEGVTVTVAEGKVAVTGAAAAAAPPARLVAGQKVDVAADGRVSRVSAADLSQATAWQTGKLVFKDATLATVVADVNRYSDRALVIGDERIRDLRVTGLFEAGDFEQVAQALARTLPVTLDSADAARIVLRHRP